MVYRKDIDYLVIAALPLSALYVAATGLVMDWFGLHRLAYHHYVGYIWAALGALHLILNWRRVAVYLQRRFRSAPIPELPKPEVRAPTWGRRHPLISIGGVVGGFVLGRLFANRWAGGPMDETSSTSC